MKFSSDKVWGGMSDEQRQELLKHCQVCIEHGIPVHLGSRKRCFNCGEASLSSVTFHYDSSYIEVWLCPECEASLNRAELKLSFSSN